MNIGLLGFEFASSNKGCEALSYSLMGILNNINLNEITLTVFNIHNGLGDIPEKYKRFKYNNITISFKSFSFWKKYFSQIRQCDFVLDITHGDSFSDIYGLKWYLKTSILKIVCILLRKPLILMPQTYGPYKHFISKLIASFIVRNAFYIYTRDSESEIFLRSNFERNDRIYTTSDLAFNLNASDFRLPENNRIKIGINISGLLWFDNNKNIKLKVDYKKYIRLLLDYLSNNNKYEIYFVPHVICNDNEGYNYYENDCRAIEEILSDYPNSSYYYDFKNAEDVKGYISQLDILLAARMHATVAAFSTGVVPIPFAYSKKFQGVYRDLNYDYVINGLELSTKEAYDKTLDLIEDFDKLNNNIKNSLLDLKHRKSQFQEKFLNILTCYSKTRS